MEDYGQSKLPLLREFLPYSDGTASDTTLQRFFASMDSAAFRQCFLDFVGYMFPEAKSRIIALDGKTSRGSADADGKNACHTVSALAADARLVLGQIATEAKSNEITVLPQLIDTLDVREAIVTIDAAGCQTKIAQKIMDKGGDYVLALKGNQKTLHGCAKRLFDTADTFADTCRDENKGHGRREVRTCEVLPAEDADFLRHMAGWPALRSVARVTSERTYKGKTTTETRYYISSLPPDAALIAYAVRSHWQVESFHWVLDVAFREDASRIRSQNAPFCMTVMRHIAFNLLQSVKTKRRSYSNIRKNAAWNDHVLKSILITGNS